MGCQKAACTGLQRPAVYSSNQDPMLGNTATAYWRKNTGWKGMVLLNLAHGSWMNLLYGDLTLLTTHLKNQNPLEPLNTNDSPASRLTLMMSTVFVPSTARTVTSVAVAETKSAWIFRPSVEVHSRA